MPWALLSPFGIEDRLLPTNDLTSPTEACDTTVTKPAEPAHSDVTTAAKCEKSPQRSSLDEQAHTADLEFCIDPSGEPN